MELKDPVQIAYRDLVVGRSALRRERMVGESLANLGADAVEQRGP